MGCHLLLHTLIERKVRQQHRRSHHLIIGTHLVAWFIGKVQRRLRQSIVAQFFREQCHHHLSCFPGCQMLGLHGGNKVIGQVHHIGRQHGGTVVHHTYLLGGMLTFVHIFKLQIKPIHTQIAHGVGITLGVIHIIRQHHALHSEIHRFV